MKKVISMEGQSPLPIFIRLPETGRRCLYTGLSRSALNLLILPCASNGYKPPVRSVSNNKKGTIRGERLILLESLLAYLFGKEQEGKSEAA